MRATPPDFRIASAEDRDMIKARYNIPPGKKAVIISQDEATCNMNDVARYGWQHQREDNHGCQVPQKDRGKGVMLCGFVSEKTGVFCCMALSRHQDMHVYFNIYIPSDLLRSFAHSGWPAVHLFGV